MKKPILSLIALTFATSAYGQSLQVVGYAGDLGEWEVTANLTEKATFWHTEFIGPLTMRHVGLCTQNEPEEKIGEIRLHKSATSVKATLLVDGIACSYTGERRDFYSGLMSCPGRPAVTLRMWLR